MNIDLLSKTEIVAQTGVDSSLLIRPSTGFLRLNLGEVWRYRELLYFLVWRTAVGAVGQ